MNRKRVLLGGGVLAVVLVAFAVWFVFLRDDAPDAVSNDAANADLDRVLDAGADDADAADPVTSDPAPSDTAPPDTVAVATDPPATVPDGIDGTWVVDDEIGEFDFETASGSFAGFRVDEELTIGAVTAVGRSGGVTGTITVADGVLTGAEVTVDMTTIKSNDSRRERAIRNTVHSSEFPTAAFTFTGGLDVSAIEVGGPAVAFEVEGDLTIVGTTRPTSFAIEANVRDDGFAVITGSTDVVWDDFGISKPTAPIVVSIADQGTLEFQLIATR